MCGGVVVGTGELHFERGIQTEGGVLDPEVRVGFADRINERAGGEIFLVGSLRMRVNRLENCGQRIRTGGNGIGEVAANMRQSAVFVEAVPVMLAVTTFLLGMRMVGVLVPVLAAVLSGTLTLLGFEGEDFGVLATAHAISVGCVVVAGCCGGSVRCRSTGTVRSRLGVGGGALCVRVSHASTLPSALAGR